MISVIIPVLNDEKYLERLLKNLKSQKVKMQVIVADYNSTDNSRKIAKKYKATIVKGGKPAVGRNNGVKAAKYENLLFLDADVSFKSDFLSKSLKQIKKRKLDGATPFSYAESTNILDKLLFAGWNFWVWLTQSVYPHAPGYCIFSTKSIHKKINGFDKSLFLGEDSNYVLKLSKKGKFRMIPTCMKTSVRRLETEGRFGMATKMILCGLYRIFFGEPKRNIFHYGYKHAK